MSTISGKRCLITGASGGLGAALAQEFGRLGCRLVLTGRNGRELDAVAAGLPGEARLEGAIAADLRTDAGLDELVTQVNSRFDGVDVLVNNAGVFPVGEFVTLTTHDLDECLAVNLRGPMILSRAFAAGMVQNGWGRIVNIASSSAYAGFADTAVYCASKHGLLGLSRALDEELRPSGVRVIAVSPGSIKTPMGRKVPGQTFDNFMEPNDVAAEVAHVAALDGNLVVNELRLGRMVMG